MSIRIRYLNSVTYLFSVWGLLHEWYLENRIPRNWLVVATQYRRCGYLQVLRLDTDVAVRYKSCGSLQTLRFITSFAVPYRSCGLLQSLRFIVSVAVIYSSFGNLQVLRFIKRNYVSKLLKFNFTRTRLRFLTLVFTTVIY